MLQAPNSFAQAPAPELRKLYALLVIDTRTELRDSVLVDRERMEKVLKRGVPRDRLEITVLTDRDVTSARILQYYQSIKADSGDALLFYYAGHGAIDPSKGHFLALQELDTKPLLRTDLRKAMQKKNPGLIVVLTDCCSERYKLPDKKRAVIPEAREAKVLDPVLGCLFFRHRGVVDITAASDNTAAFGDDHEGGLFTRSLGALLQSKLEDLGAKANFVSWQELFSRLQRDTEKAFGSWAKEHRARGEKVDQSTQKPRAFDLAGGSVNRTSLTLINASNEPLRYQYRWSGDTNWEKATIAAMASRTHQAPAGKTTASVLEVKFENGETGTLKLGKSYRWTSDTKKKRGLTDPEEPEPEKK
jgi:hypothetical protein